MEVSSFKVHLERRWGTSVSGPLKMVREDILLATLTLASQAILAGPGASLPSRFAMFPLMLSPDHEREGLGSRSGMEEAILATEFVWDVSKAAIASDGVTANADADADDNLNPRLVCEAMNASVLDTERVKRLTRESFILCVHLSICPMSNVQCGMMVMSSFIVEVEGIFLV